MSYSVDGFKGIELPPNDDDSWMYDGEEELNTAIMERQKEMEDYEAERKQRKQQNSTGKASSSLPDDFNLKDITETMQSFVQKLSSFEGAEVPENRFLSVISSFITLTLSLVLQNMLVKFDSLLSFIES